MKSVKTSALIKIFFMLVVIMCFSGCVIVNFFELNTIRPLGEHTTYEMDSIEYIGTPSLDINAGGMVSKIRKE